MEPEQYERFRQWMVCTYVNELYRGQAEVYYPEAAGDGKDGSFDFAAKRSKSFRALRSG